MEGLWVIHFFVASSHIQPERRKVVKVAGQYLHTNTF